MEESAQNLDRDTLSRLKDARRTALAVTPGKRSRPWRWFGIPAVGLTAASAVLIAVWTHFNPLPASPSSQHLEVLEILASSDELDLFGDMDFYIWLSETDDHVG